MDEGAAKTSSAKEAIPSQRSLYRFFCHHLAAAAPNPAPTAELYFLHHISPSHLLSVLPCPWATFQKHSILRHRNDFFRSVRSFFFDTTTSRNNARTPKTEAYSWVIRTQRRQMRWWDLRGALLNSTDNADRRPLSDLEEPKGIAADWAGLSLLSLMMFLCYLETRGWIWFSGDGGDGVVGEEEQEGESLRKGWSGTLLVISLTRDYFC